MLSVDYDAQEGNYFFKMGNWFAKMIKQTKTKRKFPAPISLIFESKHKNMINRVINNAC